MIIKRGEKTELEKNPENSQIKDVKTYSIYISNEFYEKLKRWKYTDETLYNGAKIDVYVEEAPRSYKVRQEGE